MALGELVDATQNRGRDGESENDIEADASHQLTPRQREIVGHIGKGWSNRQIAEHLSLTEGTVKLHVTRILKRTGSKNRTKLAVTIFDDP